MGRPFGNLCIFEDADFVFNGLATGYTFPTTYCVQNFAFLLDQRVHPPNPMFVTPGGDDPNRIGTHLLPYTGNLGLLQAISRVGAHEDVRGKSRIEVIINSGTYDIGDNVNPVEITQCVRLESRGGPVTITN